ncbi:MAG: class I SAM-dependent methyltransferase [Thermoleophilaceae bacterium]|nr:class I SAM-dependent methyltransferase [Thermoleophilaceae bacterium]
MDDAALDQLKAGQKAVWGMGDYRKIALLTDDVAGPLVDACAISAGQEVLDVAAGTGNVAVRAAREGAAVTASDLSPDLIEIGNARCAEEGLDVAWTEADVEDLPFADASFDCVASVFGAMFAPRPERAAQEMFRVVRPGNTVGMANWAPESSVGRTFGLIRDFAPPPEGVPSPFDWGVEEIVRERLGPHAGTVEIERRNCDWSFESREAALEYFGNAGPQAALKAGLTEQGRYEEFRERAWALMDELSVGEEGVRLQPEYLLVVARKRG